MTYVTQTAMRNHRFRQAYRRAREERHHACVSQLVDHVLALPVKQGFFVSVDHVLVMHRRRTEGKLPKMGALRLQMWEEIFSAMDSYRISHPGASLTEAACEVVSKATASRFFIPRPIALDLALGAEL